MKIKAVIAGPMVQGVGYRVFLMHEAVAQGIERFAALNVSDDTVVVLAEADETTISNFKEFLSTRRPKHAQVSEVRIEDFKGRVMTLQEATVLNTVEQMDKAIPILISMNGRMESMDEKMGRMDETMGRIDDKMDRMVEKQDETVDQVRGLREDLGTIHAERMERMEKDIAAIKAKIGLS
jgi:acylphosphatase